MELEIAVNKIEVRRNEHITANRIRLIGAGGEQVGIVSNADALQQAYDSDLDLVEIVPNADPPVCRIMDYGKYKFELSKKLATAKKKQKQIKIKEVKFRPSTGAGDYKVKLQSLIRFLDDGDKAKVTLRFRGREMAHQDIGKELLDRIEEDLGEHGVIEQRPKMEGRQIVMMFSPRKK